MPNSKWNFGLIFKGLKLLFILKQELESFRSFGNVLCSMHWIISTELIFEAQFAAVNFHKSCADGLIYKLIFWLELFTTSHWSSSFIFVVFNAKVYFFLLRHPSLCPWYFRKRPWDLTKRRNDIAVDDMVADMVADMSADIVAKKGTQFGRRRRKVT